MQKSVMTPITPTVFENGVLKKSGISQHYEPKTKWNGKRIKWYEDKRKEDKDNDNTSTASNAK